MKQIIHLSDLHVGSPRINNRYQVVIDALIRDRGGDAGKYILVITGDLVDNANVKGCYDKVKEGLRRLKEAGFADILVIPGNHDYGTGDRGNKKFVDLFQETFYGQIAGYPRKHIIDGIAFIGLDSMSSELNWYDGIFAEGELGKEQLRHLAVLLREDDVAKCQKRVIYLHHHPFKWRFLHQLRDARRFKKTLVHAMDEAISIDAILFGHNHGGGVHNGQWGIARCYDAGTATMKPRPAYVEWLPILKVRSSVRVIDLGQDPHTDVVLPLL